MMNNFDAEKLLRKSLENHNMQLSILIAETGLWANPEVHRRLSNGNRESAAFFPNRRRYRPGKKEFRGQRIGSIILDDNSYANNAIKYAIGVKRANLKGFEACHIWPRTCYDERYHTLIANLVLLPRALAGFTDHNDDVQAVLKYRAFELYGWYPEGEPEPAKPRGYPDIWRDPMPYSDKVAKKILTIDGRASQRERRVPSSSTARDYTKYDVVIGGETFPNQNKRKAAIRFVRGLIASGISPEKIAKATPPTPPQLFQAAPGILNSRNFIMEINRRKQEQGKRFDSTRYFCDDEWLIHFEGKTFALTNQWGDWTSSTFEAWIHAFPESGVSIVAR